jgi:hypothetical protein
VSVSDDGESTGGGGTLQVLFFLEIWCRPQDKIELYLQQDFAGSCMTVSIICCLLLCSLFCSYSFCIHVDMAHE